MGQFGIKTKKVGLGPDEVQEERVLNCVIRVTENGWEMEADQRHVDIVVQELGLQDAKPVSTPRSKDDVEKMLAEMDSPLPPKEATQYRALAARLDYLALDGADIQSATKEVAKYMSSPSQGNWLPIPTKQLHPVVPRVMPHLLLVN